MKVGLKLNLCNFPWVNILPICADRGIYIDNYPENVPFPTAKENGQRNKGVANLSKRERAMIIDALNAETNPMRFVKAKNPAGMES